MSSGYVCCAFDSTKNRQRVNISFEKDKWMQTHTNVGCRTNCKGTLTFGVFTISKYITCRVFRGSWCHLFGHMIILSRLELALLSVFQNEY